LGAAVAVSVGAIGALQISAAGSLPASTLSPITPCRLLDTRSGVDNVGARSTPLAADETYVVPVRGVNGECDIPSSAIAVAMNVTIVNGTSGSYLILFPADAGKPKASNLNWSAGQAATPNAATSPLAADGKLAIYNLAGTVDVIVDVVGYYQALPPAATTTPPTTTLPAIHLESTVTLAATNGSASPIGVSAFGGSIQAVAWMAPRTCTITGTVRVMGRVTSSPESMFLFVRVRNSTGTSIVRDSQLQYTPAIASGTQRSFDPVVVNAGELVTISEIAQSGLTITSPTTAYVSLACT
jgi:hypothetical protein